MLYQRWTASWLLSLACVLGACIPVPVITPPVRVSFTPGLGGGARPDDSASSDDTTSTRRTNATSASPGSLTPTTQPEDAPSSHPISGVLGVQVGMHPGQLFESLLTRRWDVGVGYRFEHFLNEDLDAPDLHGVYLEGAYFFHASPQDSDAAFRVGALAQGDLTFADPSPQGDLGWGASAGVIVELSTFTGGASLPSDDDNRAHSADPFDPAPNPPERSNDDNFLGVAFGELGIGASVTGGFRQAAGRDLWVALFSLHVRLPALAGVAFVPLSDIF